MLVRTWHEESIPRDIKSPHGFGCSTNNTLNPDDYYIHNPNKDIFWCVEIPLSIAKEIHLRFHQSNNNLYTLRLLTLMVLTPSTVFLIGHG